MMTFQEAKAAADRINGVVSWWWIYSVHTAEEWESYNGTMGYGTYHSKGSKAYFKARYKEEKVRRKKEFETWKQERLPILLLAAQSAA